MLFVKLKVAATEYGYALAALDGALLLALRRSPGTASGAAKAAGLMALAGGLLLILPLMRAVGFSRGLGRRLERAFGPVAGRVSNGGEPLLRRSRVSGAAGPRAALRAVGPRAERVSFSEVAGCRLEFDLYRPAAARGGPRTGGAPCVVVHGGRWTEGNSRDFAALNPYLAARGYAVVSTNYRKAGRHPFPAALQDVESAVVYVKRHARELDIDPGRIALLGRSAGGQLALLAAYRNPGTGVRGVVSYYGPTDLHYGYHDRTNPLVIDNVETLETYTGTNPFEDPGVYDSASPIKFVAAHSPPTLLVHGAMDEVVHPAHSDRLAARLREAGIPHLYLRLPWATHGFDHNLRGPSGLVSTYALEWFLESVLRA